MEDGIYKVIEDLIDRSQEINEFLIKKGDYIELKKVYYCLYFPNIKKFKNPSAFIKLVNRILKYRVFEDKRRYMEFKRNYFVECYRNSHRDRIHSVIKFFSIEKFTEYIVSLIQLEAFQDYDNVRNILDEVIDYLQDKLINKHEKHNEIYSEYRLEQKYEDISLKLSKIYVLFNKVEAELGNIYEDRYQVAIFLQRRFDEIKRVYI
jgi:hypothetical protein